MKAWQNNASSNTTSTQRKLTTDKLFENLFKPRQRRLAVGMLLTSSVLSTTSKQCFELTSSVLSTTSNQCFEQPAASLLFDFH